MKAKIVKDDNRIIKKRKPRFEESYTKTLVTLLDRHIKWLDDIAEIIHNNTGKPVNRGALIRACVEAIQESGIKLEKSKNILDVKQKILKKMGIL